MSLTDFGFQEREIPYSDKLQNNRKTFTGHTQVEMGQDVAEVKAEMKAKKEEAEKWERERAKIQAEFDKHYKQGATSVILHKGVYYFWGDVSHCGKDNIVNNATEIKKRMGKNKYGHMNCNDLPTFDEALPKPYNRDNKKISAWDELERQRTETYKDDLYKFVGKKVVLVDTISDKEQEQRYCMEEVDGEAECYYDDDIDGLDDEGEDDE